MFLQDIAFGLFIAVFVSLLGNYEPSVWLLVAGVAAAVLPDWDMIAYLIGGGKLDQWAHRHRDISHYPLLTIPVVAGITGYFQSLQFVIIIAIAMNVHYFLDSREIGWGVRWLYPISNRYFAYRRLGDANPKLYAWTPEEQFEVACRYGNPHWAKETKRWKHDAFLLMMSVALAIAWYT